MDAERDRAGRPTAGGLDRRRHRRAARERPSGSDDRFRKPAQYAQAGIGVYLRVELDPPHVAAYAIGADGLYVETGRAEPGELLTLTEPFAFSVDPAVLLR